MPASVFGYDSLGISSAGIFATTRAPGAPGYLAFFSSSPFRLVDGSVSLSRPTLHRLGRAGRDLGEDAPAMGVEVDANNGAPGAVLRVHPTVADQVHRTSTTASSDSSENGRSAALTRPPRPAVART
jgi:hypothetical protein